jgi:hypothetical protein
MKTKASGPGAAPILRTPLILLAVADLAGLAMRLRPWPEVAKLPGNGTTAYDPAICLIAYILLMFLMGGTRKSGMRRALGGGTVLGLLAGAALVAEVVLVRPPATENGYVGIGLLCAAGILCGAAGLRGARAGGVGLGLLAGIWSAMVAGLMACATVLAQMNPSNAGPISLDPWKQYEGLAIGNQAVQSLVHSLNAATAFLLIGPLVGGALGLIFALMAQPQKD